MARILSRRIKVNALATSWARAGGGVGPTEWS
jgi:hypothetical protein